VQVLLGHTDIVHQVAWMPDGERLVSVSSDGRLLIWDVDSGEATLLRMDDRPLNAVVVTPDGRVAYGGKSDNLRILEIISGEARALSNRPIGEPDRVMSMALTPDGRTAILGSLPAIGSWDLDSDQLDWFRTGYVVNGVAVTPDGSRAVYGGHNNEPNPFALTVWDLAKGERTRLASGHSHEIGPVCTTSDGNFALSGSADNTIKIWDLSTLRLVRSLQAHSGAVVAIALSRDGKLFASHSWDNTLRIWECDRWEEFASLDLPCRGFPSALAFHPQDSRLAVADESDHSIKIFELDYKQLRSGVPTGLQRPVRYSNAKVVLVGDSGVGKSGLGLILSGQPFAPTESTHGRRVWEFDRFEASTSTGSETREVLLWDLAGQPGYRIVHQLHLDEVAVALVIFDARSDTDVFSGVRHWARALKQASQAREGTVLAPKIFLVAARTDRGGPGVSRERVRQVIAECGFEDHYLETSAKEGQGIAELRQAILDAIAWDELPRVSSSTLFYRIKEFLIAEKASGRLLATADDLYARMLRQHPDLDDQEDHRSEFETCISLVAARGLIQRLSFGGLVLLRPELLDAYASSMVNTAKDQPDGIGSLPEADARSGNFRMAADERIGDKEEEKLICIATVEGLLRQEVVLRELTLDGPLLVFPSQFTRDWPEAPEPPDKDLVFTFEGPVSNVYATLAVRLSHSGQFRLKGMFRNAAIYTPIEDAGKCGLFLRDFGEGRAELSLFYLERSDQKTRDVFEDYVSAHLQRRALPKTIQRRRTFRCGNCGTVVPDPSAEIRRSLGLKAILCARCESLVSLEDRAEDEKREFSSAVQSIDEEADARRDGAAAQLALAGKRQTGDYDLFLCFGDEDRTLVQEIAAGLLDVGILCWPDDWDTTGAGGAPPMAGQVATIKEAAILVGPGCPDPWNDPDCEVLLQVFAERQAPIALVRLTGALEKPLPAYLDRVARRDFRVDRIEAGKEPEAVESVVVKGPPGTGKQTQFETKHKSLAAAMIRRSASAFALPTLATRSIFFSEPEILPSIQVELINGRPVPVGVEIPTDRLQLRRMTLRNVKCLENLDLSLVTERGEPRRWSLLLGENGCGKTTVLRALALLTGGSGAFGELIGNPDDWIRKGKDSCSIQAEFSLGRGRPSVFELTWNRGWSLAQVFASNQASFKGLDALLAQSARNFLAAGYGCSRHLNRMVPVGGEGDRPVDPRAAAVATLFSADAVMYPLSAFALELQVRRQSKGLEIVRNMLKDLLLGMQLPELDPERKDLVFRTTDGLLPLTQLSDGYQNISAWCGDLLYRIFTATEAETDPASAHGLLLIDEIDLHLHPVWQRQLRRFLTEKLPNFQIVATTHSPLTAQQSEPGELFTLRRLAPDQPPVLVPFPDDPRIFMLQQIVTSPAFNLPTQDSEFVEEKRRAFRQLRDQPSRSPEEQERMNGLRDQIENLPYPGNELVNYEKEHKALLERIAQALETGDNGPSSAFTVSSSNALETAPRAAKPTRKRR
jgi:WD40 repeat protein/energy-coupling factor transporter ATP-binding protein EcfA2